MIHEKYITHQANRRFLLFSDTYRHSLRPTVMASKVATLAPSPSGLYRGSAVWVGDDTWEMMEEE